MGLVSMVYDGMLLLRSTCLIAQVMKHLVSGLYVRINGVVVDWFRHKISNDVSTDVVFVVRHRCGL